MGRRSPSSGHYSEDPLASSRRLCLGSPRLMVDFQFLGMVALVLAVVTRGAVLPVLVMTAVIALVTLAYEAGARRLRRRHTHPAGSGGSGAPVPSDSELTRWMSVMARMLRSND
jgi:hypothetical protein